MEIWRLIFHSAVLCYETKMRQPEVYEGVFWIDILSAFYENTK